MRRLRSTKAWKCTHNWSSLMDVVKQSTTQQLSTKQLIKAELHATTRSFETFPRCFSLSPVFSPMALAHAHFCKESFARHYDSFWNLYDVPNYKTHAPPVTISREQTRDATIKTSVGSNLLPVLISCVKINTIYYIFWILAPFPSFPTFDVCWASWHPWRQAELDCDHQPVVFLDFVTSMDAILLLCKNSACDCSAPFCNSWHFEPIG